MSSSKAHKRNLFTLFKLFLISSYLIESCFSYSCNYPEIPLTISEASISQAAICPKLPLLVRYRIDGGGSITCTSTTSANVIASDTTLIPEALCAQIYPLSNSIPSKQTLTCPSGKRNTTLSEANLYNAQICPMLDMWDTVKIEEDFVIKGQGFTGGQNCLIEPRNGVDAGNVLCTDLPEINIQFVSSGEPNCIPPCLTCENLTTTCTSCTSSKYLYDNKCYESCPINTYVSSPTTCRGNLHYIFPLTFV